MSSPNLHPPIPRQPIGTTFIVAICVLGLFAALQFVAVVIHFIPLMKQQIADTVPQAVPEAPAPMMPAFTPAPLAPAGDQQTALSAPNRQRVMQLLSEANSNYRVGEYDGALRLLDQVEEISPSDRSVLVLRAQIFEQAGQPSEAILAIDELLHSPGLTSQERAGLQRKLDMLSQQVSSLPQRAVPGTGRSTGMADASGEAARDSNGVQPGSSLGIVTVRLSDGAPGTKKLMVAVKSADEQPINVQDVKIYVYFYEQDENGEIVITDSKVVPQWLSPPINWADKGEPELLESQYTLPTDGRQYYGYVVAVYYNKELQDFRAEPSKLARDFEVPLYLRDTPVEQ